MPDSIEGQFQGLILLLPLIFIIARGLSTAHYYALSALLAWWIGSLAIQDIVGSYIAPSANMMFTAVIGCIICSLSRKTVGSWPLILTMFFILSIVWELICYVFKVPEMAMYRYHIGSIFYYAPVLWLGWHPSKKEPANEQLSSINT